VRVFQPGQNPALFAEAPLAGAAEPASCDHLHRRLLREFLILAGGEINRSHPARADNGGKAPGAQPLAEQSVGFTRCRR
jgi:hypothetical protein